MSVTSQKPLHWTSAEDERALYAAIPYIRRNSGKATLVSEALIVQISPEAIRQIPYVGLSALDSPSPRLHAALRPSSLVQTCVARVSHLQLIAWQGIDEFYTRPRPTSSCKPLICVFEVSMSRCSFCFRPGRIKQSQAKAQSRPYWALKSTSTAQNKNLLLPTTWIRALQQMRHEVQLVLSFVPQLLPTYAGLSNSDFDVSCRSDTPAAVVTLS